MKKKKPCCLSFLHLLIIARRGYKIVTNPHPENTTDFSRLGYSEIGIKAFLEGEKATRLAVMACHHSS